MPKPRLVLTGALLGAAVLVSSCAALGPIYDTRNVYSPPASALGRACIAQCDSARSLCQRSEQMRSETWQRREREAYQSCLQRRKQTPSLVCTDRSFQYRPDYSACTASYNACYSSCGGAVRSERVCVLNCDQAR